MPNKLNKIKWQSQKIASGDANGINLWQHPNMLAELMIRFHKQSCEQSLLEFCAKKHKV